jgi:hypothetical protein
MSWKIRTNKFVKKQKIDGIEVFNIHGLSGDNSML